jgi:hypothetical protein
MEKLSSHVGLHRAWRVIEHSDVRFLLG